MKISARLLLGFMAVIGIVIAFSSIVFFSVRQLTSYNDYIITRVLYAAGVSQEDARHNDRFKTG